MVSQGPRSFQNLTRIAKNLLAGDSTARNRATTHQPIQAADGCLIYGQDGMWWAYFTLQVISSYEYRSTGVKQAIQGRLTNLFKQLVGYEFHFITVPYEFDAERLRAIWVNSYNGDNDGYQAYVDQVTANAHVMQDRGYQARVLRLGICLGDRDYPGSTRDAPAKLNPRELEIYGIKAKTNYRLVPHVRTLLGKMQTAGFENARPVDQSEMLNLALRAIWPGCKDRPPLVMSKQTKMYDADELAYLGENDVLDCVDHVQIQNFGRTTYATFLSLSKLPFEPVCPGQEYLWLIDAYGNPVATSVRGTVVAAGTIASETTKSVADAVSHAEFIRIKNEESGQAEIARAVDALERKQEYVQSGQPMIRFRATAILTSDDLDTLYQLQRELVQTAATRDIGWVAARGIQTQLYNETIPGSGSRTIRYVHDASADSAAAGMFHVTGLPRYMGPYVGELTGKERGPLLYTPSEVLEPGADTGTVTLFIGPPGGGKTFAGLYTCILMAMQGATVLVREGTKGDIRQRFNPPPGLRVHNVAFEDFPGGLNPGLLGQTPEENAEIMAEWLLSCCSAYNKSWRGPLYAACKEEVEAHPNDPDYRRVIQTLRERRGTEYDIGLDLAQIADLRQGDACWGTRENVDMLIDRLGPGLSMWSAEGWLFPHKDKPEDRWTALERFSVAGLELMFYLGRRVSLDRNRITYTFDDELHEIGGTRVFAGLDRIGRFGRSQQALAAFATHSWADLPSDFLKYATTVFVFRQDREDAYRAAQVLGLDADDPNIIDEIRKLGCDEFGTFQPDYKGEFMLRRYDGSVIKGRFLEELWMGPHGFVSNTQAYQQINSRRE